MAAGKTKIDIPQRVLKNLHLDVETADAIFIFDIVDPTTGRITTKTLYAHKNILAGGSLVFRSMFYGALKESKNVSITDISYDGFSEFIHLFYSSRAALSKDNIFEVLRAVDKYDARLCLPKCLNFLEGIMNHENVCNILGNVFKIPANNAQWKSVVDRAFNMIEKNTVKVFRSEEFLSCDKSVLRKILQMNRLSCASELNICIAAMKWAGRCCATKGVRPTDTNKRIELGESFKLIRFTTLKVEEFLELHEKYPKLFTYPEFQDMVQHKIRQKATKFFENFNSTKRTFEVVYKFKWNPPAYSSILQHLE